ncbi:MAG: hypothetical protein HY321_18485 [Armatimonadetes bacterium]|nr:hypothetical protein [Armatimonadota bacterium]
MRRIVTLLGIMALLAGIAGLSPLQARQFDVKRAVALVGELPGFDEPTVSDPRERVAGLVELLAQEIADPSEPVSGGICTTEVVTSALHRATLVWYLGTPPGFRGSRGISPPELVLDVYQRIRDPELRRHLAIALAMAGVVAFADVAAETAVYDPEPEMREVGLRALYALPQPRFLPVFLQSLADPTADCRGVRPIANLGRACLRKLGFQVRYEEPFYRVRDPQGNLLYTVNTANRVIEATGVAVAVVEKMEKAAPPLPAKKESAKPAPAAGKSSPKAAPARKPRPTVAKPKAR